jgi:hypothetical protein
MSHNGTKTFSRGPQPWSVERSVSKPRTSEPDPMSAAECRPGTKDETTSS